MNTLMEFIRTCPKMDTAQHYNAKADSALKKAEDLRELGFRYMASRLSQKARTEARLNSLAKEKYTRITSVDIQNFLNKKAAFYSWQNRGKDEKDVTLQEFEKMIGGITGQRLQEYSGLFSSRTTWSPYSPSDTTASNILFANTTDLLSDQPGKIGRFMWIETRVDDYGQVPPEPVLQALRAEKKKNLFDYFTIASVNSIQDPVLLGRIDGLNDRYFLFQWGEDVALDDLI